MIGKISFIDKTAFWANLDVCLMLCDLHFHHWNFKFLTTLYIRCFHIGKTALAIFTRMNVMLFNKIRICNLTQRQSRMTILPTCIATCIFSLAFWFGFFQSITRRGFTTVLAIFRKLTF